MSKQSSRFGLHPVLSVLTQTQSEAHSKSQCCRCVAHFFVEFCFLWCSVSKKIFTYLVTLFIHPRLLCKNESRIHVADVSSECPSPTPQRAKSPAVVSSSSGSHFYLSNVSVQFNTLTKTSDLTAFPSTSHTLVYLLFFSESNDFNSPFMHAPSGVWADCPVPVWQCPTFPLAQKGITTTRIPSDLAILGSAMWHRGV